MINKTSVNNFFVKLDKFCDYVPLISTLSNLTDLFQKCFFIPCMSRQFINNNYYYSHLKSKSSLLSIGFLIPVGNLIIIFYRRNKKKQYKNKEFILGLVRIDGMKLEYASKRLKRDSEVVLAALKSDIRAFGYASRELTSDFNFMLEAVSKNEDALGFASGGLTRNSTFMVEAFKKNPKALKFADKSLTSNSCFMHEVVKTNWSAFDYASPELQMDQDLLLFAIDRYSIAVLANASDQITGNTNFMHEAVKINPRALKYANEAVRDDEKILLTAVNIDGCSIEFATENLKNSKKIALAAVKQNSEALHILDEKMRQDKDILLAAIDINNPNANENIFDDFPDIQEFIKSSFENDIDFAIQICSIQPKYLKSCKNFERLEEVVKSLKSNLEIEDKKRTKVIQIINSLSDEVIDNNTKDQLVADFQGVVSIKSARSQL